MGAAAAAACATGGVATACTEVVPDLISRLVALALVADAAVVFVDGRAEVADASAGADSASCATIFVLVVSTRRASRA